MGGCIQRLLLLSALTMVSSVSGDEPIVYGSYSCYSCTGSADSQHCGYTSVRGTGTENDCSYGCAIQMTGNFGDSYPSATQKQMERGCRTPSLSGCSYNSKTGQVTCSNGCSSSLCNGGMTVRDLDCYVCDSETNKNCERISPWTPTRKCDNGGCRTFVTISSSGSIVNIDRNCAGNVLEGSYSYPSGSRGNTIHVWMCNSNLCNTVDENTLKARNSSGVQYCSFLGCAISMLVSAAVYRLMGMRRHCYMR